MKFIRTARAALLLAALTLPTTAIAQTMLYPERVGAETARFYRGQPTVSLRLPGGTVEIRPLPAEKGRVMLSVALFNTSDWPANLGIENISAGVNGIPTGLPTYDQLVAQAEDRARSNSRKTSRERRGYPVDHEETCTSGHYEEFDFLGCRKTQGPFPSGSEASGCNRAGVHH